jgi:hypothetical protein
MGGGWLCKCYPTLPTPAFYTQRRACGPRGSLQAGYHCSGGRCWQLLAAAVTIAVTVAVGLPSAPALGGGGRGGARLPQWPCPPLRQAVPASARPCPPTVPPRPPTPPPRR